MRQFLKFILEWNSTCFGQFLCPSYEFFTVHIAMVYVIQVCWLLASCQQMCMTYTIPVCTVKNSWWWTEELSETCRLSFQNKFEKLVHLVGFIIRNVDTYFIIFVPPESLLNMTWLRDKNFISAINFTLMKDLIFLLRYSLYRNDISVKALQIYCFSSIRRSVSCL